MNHTAGNAMDKGAAIPGLRSWVSVECTYTMGLSHIPCGWSGRVCQFWQSMPGLAEYARGAAGREYLPRR